jgi:hypothetical protein
VAFHSFTPCTAILIIINIFFFGKNGLAGRKRGRNRAFMGRSRDFRRASSDKTKAITDEYLLNRYLISSHLHRIYRSVNKSSVDIIK